jgi:AraC-like DNA-binding protein
MSTADFSRIELSLDELPARDRLAIYREVIGRQMVKWEIEPSPDAPVSAEMVWRGLPDLEILTGDVGASTMGRTRELIARDPNDGFALALGMGGNWQTTANGRALSANASEATLISLTEPSAVVTPTRSSFLVLQMSRAALAARIPNLDDAARRDVPRDLAPFRLLRDYLNVLGRQETLSTPGLCRTVSGHIYDLVALAIGASPDAAEQARRNGLSAAALQEIKTDIEANLRRPDLSLGLIAAGRGVSVRRVQRLFEAAGLTFSAFVLERRLALANAMLRDPRHRHQTIAEITFECGFGDISHFNRAFRRAYGMTPSDVREISRERERAAPFPVPPMPLRAPARIG